MKQIMVLKDIATQNPEPAPKNHYLIKKRPIYGFKILKIVPEQYSGVIQIKATLAATR